MQILWQVLKAEELFSDGHSTQCFSLPHTLDVSVRNDKPTSSVQRLFIARLWNLGLTCAYETRKARLWLKREIGYAVSPQCCD